MIEPTRCFSARLIGWGSVPDFGFGRRLLRRQPAGKDWAGFVLRAMRSSAKRKSLETKSKIGSDFQERPGPRPHVQSLYVIWMISRAP
jgi:hypothetical protein